MKDWKEYIRILFGFFQSSMNTPIVDMSKAPEQAIDFMSPYILNSSEISWKDNLRGSLPNELRDKFILRFTENPHLIMILSSDLLVDKIYQGLRFDFVKIAKKNSILNKMGKPITQSELNSILGRDFGSPVKPCV